MSETRVSVHYRHLQLRRQYKSTKEQERHKDGVHNRHLQFRRQCKFSNEQQRQRVSVSIDICNSGVNVSPVKNSRDKKSNCLV